MIINHQYRFIFIKVQKTAGTSVEIALSQFCGPTDVITPLHKKDEALRASLGGRGSQNYYLPLNSYRRADILGCLKARKRKRYYNHSNAAAVRGHAGEAIWNSYFKFCFERNPFDKAISHYYWGRESELETVAEYLNKAEHNLLSDWDMYTRNDHIAVDFVGRYESLEDDLLEIAEKLKLPKFAVPQAKHEYRVDRRNYQQVLDAQSRAIIETTYVKELQEFGYRWAA
jgi:hypothetical protein